MYTTTTPEDRLYRATALLNYMKEMELNLLDAGIASGQQQITFSIEALRGLQALHEIMAEHLAQPDPTAIK